MAEEMRLRMQWDWNALGSILPLCSCPAAYCKKRVADASAEIDRQLAEAGMVVVPKSALTATRMVDRPATNPEVTPDMIEAGVDALILFRGEGDLHLVEEIGRAMFRRLP